MKKRKGNPLLVGGVCLLLAGALGFGNYMCYTYENTITMFLCGQGFNEDSQAAIAARNEGMALAREVEAQGAVLLKNENNTLPLKNKKVNVFGWSGSDAGFMRQGSGSGAGSTNNLVTFLGGLKEAGVEYNETLAEAYKDLGWSRASGGSYVIEAHGQRYKDFYGIAEAPESFYTDSLMSNAKAYSDTAVVVLGRFMGEGNDFSKTQYTSEGSRQVSEDATKKLQSLSAREEYMIEKVTQNFENVIIVTNTGNPIELEIADNEKIDAVINMGMPGTRGTIAIGDILLGKVTPSGKLADTWAYDLSTAASYATSGLEGALKYTDMDSYYTEYREDIYSGYYWYETADKEGFWDSEYAKNRWGLKKGYDDVVQYPFGYGLSYTTFSWYLNSANVKNGTVLAQDGKIELEVVVTNTGDYEGQDVVELYYSAPYTKGGIEKSAIKLGAFAKTSVLKPGQFEILKLEMDVEEMKSYDCYDKNNNGFMGYELEAGDYVLSLRTDVHHLKEMDNNEIKVNVNGGFRYEVDSTTGNPVTNQFTTYTNTASGASSKVNEPFCPTAHSIDGSENDGGAIKYMTRADFVGTFPKETGAARSAGNLKTDMYEVPAPVQEEGAEAPEFDSDATDWTISDVYGVDYDDPMWDELVSQLSLDKCFLIVARGGFGTIEVPEIGKPKTKDADGPSGFNTNVTGSNSLKAVNYPSSTVLAQTWDWYMAYQVGRAIGIEGNALGIDGWYGPGGNLHRSAMGGRNFEYYSEDAVLSGIIGAYHVYGAKEKGILAYIKHLGTNEDDAQRNAGGACFKWLTEQSLRENYLKPFEYLVKIGGTHGMMSAFTRTGGMRSSGSYALLTGVLRNEWGFRGTVITDYYTDRNGLGIDIDEGIRAGSTQVLNPDFTRTLFDDSKSDTAKKYIHQSVKDVLYSYVATKYFAENAQGLEHGSLIGEATETFAWWKPLLVGIDALCVLLMLRAVIRAAKPVKVLETVVEAEDGDADAEPETDVDVD